MDQDTCFANHLVQEGELYISRWDNIHEKLT